MSTPRRYRAKQPPPHSGPVSPPEVAVLAPRSGAPAGPLVKLLPGSPAPEVFVLQPRGIGPAPRARLRLALAVPAGADAALATATFVAGVVGFDRKLKLALDPARTSATDGAVNLVFDAAPLGADLAPRLNRLLARANELAAACAPLALTSATVEAC
jgi:hypothetical protein